MRGHLWLGDKELLVLEVANGPADSQAAIDPCDAVFHGDKSIIANNSFVFVASARGLVVSQLRKGAVLLQKVCARIPEVRDSVVTV